MKKIKSTFLVSFKVLTSFCVAYVIAIIGQELISYSSFSFVFIALSVGSGFFYLIRPYKLKGVFILNLIFVSLAVGMKFYITAAYNAPV